ncbi:ParB/RepB/Spo0J family partition protein [Oceanospirillum sp.]|uniref:ParB/RepB/Spo0J family partition protein n=1 Tax=Oceanospirillum sp. TaxID=2021254 RepID=UPI003A914B5C
MLFNLLDEKGSKRNSSEEQPSQEWGTSLQDQLKQQPLTHLPVDKVIPDPDQPRKSFDDESLLDLAQSIEENGLLQPIVVQPEDANGNHRIIMGERRWRAHDYAGKESIPAIIRPESDSTVLALQIIENNQREDIAPLEEARALQRLVDVSGNKKAVAQALGRSPSWLSKRLSLLKTPDVVQVFADQHAVKDINTLNSLSKLYQTAPDEAQQLMSDVTKSGVEGGLRSRIEQKRQQLQEPATSASQESAVSGIEENRAFENTEMPQGVATTAKKTAAEPDSPLNQQLQLQLQQQLRMSPLNSLEGIENLDMSFPEIEQHFRRYLQCTDLNTGFQGLWQTFLEDIKR